MEKNIKEKKLLGMIMMCERVELVGGIIKIVSSNKWMSVKVNVLLWCENEGSLWK